MTPPDFQALFDLASDGLVVIDASLNVVRVNRAFAEMIGTAADALVGRSIVSLVHPADLAENPIRTALVMRDGSTVSTRRLVRADGTAIDAEIVSSRLPEGAMLCAVRVSARPASETILRETEARFSAVADNLHAGLAVTDLDNRAVYVNGYLCERTGYAREELVGRRLASVFLSREDQERDRE